VVRTTGTIQWNYGLFVEMFIFLFKTGCNGKNRTQRGNHIIMEWPITDIVCFYKLYLCKYLFCRIMAVPATVLYFTLYDQLNARFKHALTHNPYFDAPLLLAPISAGALARSTF
jgi:hypothetical protein